MKLLEEIESLYTKGKPQVCLPFPSPSADLWNSLSKKRTHHVCCLRVGLMGGVIDSSTRKEMSADSRPTINRLFTDCRLVVARPFFYSNMYVVYGIF